jgi:hypothetical protein
MDANPIIGELMASGIDYGFGADNMGVGVTAGLHESGRERTTLRVERWDAEQVAWTKARFGLHSDPAKSHFVAADVRPYLITEYHGNLITEAGWTLFLHGKTILSTDSAPTIWFDSTHGRIGVGTSVSAANAADTALGSIGSMTGNNWKLTGAAPTVTTTGAPSTVVFVASFASTDAVGAWNEFAVDQGTASAASTSATAPMLNHSTNIAQGTKATGQVWTATATLSFT